MLTGEVFDVNGIREQAKIYDSLTPAHREPITHERYHDVTQQLHDEIYGGGDYAAPL